MKDSILQILSCPNCGAAMTQTEDKKVARCLGIKTHCFDFAKNGSLFLAGARAGDGDSKEAILSRRSFLDAGYYEVLSDKINELMDSIGARVILDAGCGEGYYTNRMAQNRSVLGIDLSRAGIEYASRRAKQFNTGAAFAVASIFSLPVQDSSLDAITNIFAPCSEIDFCRALKSGGYLCLVGAGERHLMGLKELLYENPYHNPGRSDLPQNMTAVEKHRIYTTVTIDGQELIQALFSMTPYYWRTSPKDREKLTQVDSLTTEIDFDLFLYRKDS